MRSAVVRPWINTPPLRGCSLGTRAGPGLLFLRTPISSLAPEPLAPVGDSFRGSADSVHVRIMSMGIVFVFGKVDRAAGATGRSNY